MSVIHAVMGVGAYLAASRLRPGGSVLDPLVVLGGALLSSFIAVGGNDAFGRASAFLTGYTLAATVEQGLRGR